MFLTEPIGLGMFSSCAVREVEGRCLVVSPSSRIALRELIAYSLDQLHKFCSSGRFWSAMCSGVTTEVGGVGHALATYDRRPWCTNSSRLDENLVFETAESAEEKCNYNSFSNGQDE